MKTLKSISVFGLGKLGACMAATFAHRGFDVLGVDKAAWAVERFASSQTAWDEPGLGQMIKDNFSRLSVTSSPELAVTTDVSFIIVPSPSLPDGSFSNEFILEAITPLANACKKAGKTDHMFVVSSTTSPGACREVIIPHIESILGKGNFFFCYNPEFIALGNVLQGLLIPDMVLIGAMEGLSGLKLADLYARYCFGNPPVSRMNTTSAELAKISLNAYVTMKISFTNQIRLIASGYADTDISAILSAIGSDSRVGKKFLRPGLSYGGPCFPRDNRMLIQAAKKVGMEAPLASATENVNQYALADFARSVLDLTDGTVLVLGMAYRPNTSIVEESAGLYVARHLKRVGRRVIVHDYAARPENTPALEDFEFLDVARMPITNDIGLVVICTEWPGYRDLAVPKHIIVVDPWGIRK